MNNLLQNSLQKTNKFVLGLITLLGFAIGTNQAVAQAPGATCVLASTIAVGSCSGAQVISDFTQEVGTPAFSCGGTFRREGWYKFVAPGGSPITVTATTTTTTANLEIQVISGTCGVGTESQIACVNNTAASNCQLEVATLGALAAGTYYIRILNVGAATNMTNTNTCVNITPSNDDCAGATVLTPGGAGLNCTVGATYSTAGASQTIAAGACGAAGAANDDIWFTFNATATSQIITVTPSASFNAVFEVFSTSCGGTSINCTNGFGVGGTETATVSNLTVGNPYWIRVYDNGANCNGIPTTSTFTICIQTPPANDECAGAIPLATNTTCITTTGDVNVATNSGIAACGSGLSNPDDDVWYSFVATCTSQSITVTGSPSFDPSFEVFSGTCAGGLTSILCNAPGGQAGLPITSSVSGLTIGNTYYVRVYDYGVAYPATTTFTICVVNAPPANDNCAGAIALTTPSTTCTPTNGDVCGATQSLAGCSGNANDDIWYSFVAQQSIQIVTVVGSASFDAVFEVFSSCGGASLGCTNATGTGGTETASFSGLTVNNTYYVRVYDAGAGFPASTTFTICVTSPPLNDDCGGFTAPVNGSTATPSGCVTSINGTVLAASPSGFAATCGGTPNDDVWYTFQATATSHIITVIPCATFDPVIQVYKNTCGTGLNVGCMNALGAGGTETMTVSGLIVNNFYWIRIYDFTGSSACATFNLCITTPPVNDPCSAPTTLTPSTTCVATNGTLAGATNSGIAVGAGACVGTTPSDDVWYTFNAGSTSQTITVAGVAGLDVIFELFSSNPCGGVGTSLGCTNATGSGGTESQTFAGLTAGGQYWVRVYSVGSPTAYTFTICVITPVNNTCANAISVTCGNSYSGNSNVATVANAPATCTSNVTIYPGVWFVFAGNGNNVTASLCGGTSYDSQIYIYSSTGPCTGLTCIAGDDDMNALCPSNGLASFATFGTQVGTNYYIYVTSYSGATGPYVLTISCVTPPVNDQCTGAIHTWCNSTTQTYTGSTVNASGIGDLTNCGGASGANAQYPRALWYSYTGDGSTVTFSLCTAGGGAAAMSNNQPSILAIWSTTPYAAYCAGTFNCIAGAIGGCGGVPNNAQITLATTAYVDYWIEVYGYYVPAFSGESVGTFTLAVSTPACQNIILPIELLSFTGESSGRRNLLKWKTASESNNDYFTVERANDGVSFMTMTRVQGAGNSAHEIDYSTYDNNPENGVTYYRLKQTDYNGAYTYSSVITVNNSMDAVDVSNVRPNPTSDDVSFDFYSAIKGNVHIQIMDYLGRVVSDEVQTVTDGNTIITSKMNELGKGIYSLKITFDQTGYSSVTKVVKN